MEEKLYKLGLNEKEVKVYLYLIEYGLSPASEIGKNTGLPKSTVNFLADNLWRKGILKKTFRGTTGFFETDLLKFEENIMGEILEKGNILKEILPILRDRNKNIISKPKIIFIDGIENCKRYYSEILNIKGTFYEFGAHEDLENAFGKNFMEDFISNRVKKDIFCDSIGTTGEIENSLQLLDKQQNRSLKIFDKEIFGEIASSIVIYENKVLILNLVNIFTGVLIENKEFAETMKTIFKISKI